MRAAPERVQVRVAELGGVIVGDYVNSRTPLDIVCGNGHACSPRPDSLIQGQGICGRCTGGGGRVPSQFAEVDFRNEMARIRATVVGAYRGSKVPVEVRCSKGHICWPRPNGVQKGRDICLRCSGQAWDAFYVVASADREVVKLGITSGNPKSRLAVHRRAGLPSVLRLRKSMPEGTARALELRTLDVLKTAGAEPVRGREYFSRRELGLILETVDAGFSMRS